MKARQFSWYLDVTPNNAISIMGYPEGRNGVNMCEKCAENFLQNEWVIPDTMANQVNRPASCWICDAEARP